MSEPPRKTVGRRRPSPRPSLEDLEGFFQLGLALRPTPHLVPRGLFRFKTFEEAQEWMDRQILETLRRSSPDRPR